jgi:hypothetical protein
MVSSTRLEINNGYCIIIVIMSDSKLKLIFDDFTWQRPASRKKGFTWGEGTGEDRCLVGVPGAAFQPYCPHAGIFRDFAGLKPTPEAVLTFANRYGALHQRPEFNTLASWRQGIRHLNQLVTLSDAVTAGDCKQIARALEPFLAEPALADAADIRPIRQKQKRGASVSPDELAHAAVARLYQAIAPAERFQAQGSWRSMSGGVVVRLQYADLLDFMFAQLGHALIGGRRFRPCAACGKWFRLTPGVNRANRTTCSGYCRLRLHRQRRAKAEELGRRGWSPQRIAQEVGSEVSTVRQWLNRAKE